MKCFLRANSTEIRQRLKDSGIEACICTTFNNAEWLSYSECGKSLEVHGIYPGNDKEEWGTERIFGNKDNFKEVFLSNNRDYMDCGEDIDLFIKAIKNEH